MLKSTNLIKEISIHYKPEIVKCNPQTLFTPELEWLQPTSGCFLDNIKKNIIPDDIYNYLLSLPTDKVFQFLIGFHAINFQYWEPKEPAGFQPYIHLNQSGFYAALFAFKDMFIQLSKENRISLTQADIFQSFNNIPLLTERFNILQTVWEPSMLETAYKLIQTHIKKGVFAVNTAIELQKLIPTVFNDMFLRKNILFLWDFLDIYNLQNTNTIQDKLPVVSDHQVAKVFHMYNMVTYCPDVENTVINNLMFESYSENELAIRSACFFLSNQICERKKISPYQLYKSIWMMRASKKNPFILVQTHDY